MISEWMHRIRVARRQAARRKWGVLFDRSLQLADLLDRFATQVQVLGRDYILLRTAPEQPDIELERKRAFVAAIGKLDRALQVLKREVLDGAVEADK